MAILWRSFFPSSLKKKKKITKHCKCIQKWDLIGMMYPLHVILYFQKNKQKLV